MEDPLEYIPKYFALVALGPHIVGRSTARAKKLAGPAVDRCAEKDELRS